jgi:hypothetical protein
MQRELEGKGGLPHPAFGVADGDDHLPMAFIVKTDEACRRMLGA